MKRSEILSIAGTLFVLFSSLSYADFSGPEIIIKGPEMVKSSPVNPGTPKDTSDEICIVGHGADLDKDSDRQKAFIAAFCDALRNIIQIKKGVVTQSNNEKVDNKLIPVINVSSSGRIGSFEIISNTQTEDLTLIEDKVIVKYNNIIITIINSVLVSPTIEKINFIHWDNFPQNIGGIEVTDVTFDSNGICEVQLSCKDKNQ